VKPTTTPPEKEDPRILHAAREYLAELEAGRAPNRASYLARWPELTGELVECFDGIDLAHGASLSLEPERPVLPALPANMLGDFQIIREIGRGGMGIVYEAMQLSLNRRVALKVLPFAAGLDAKHLARFRTEAHAAAALHHTNIVPVHAVGCERGVHFYAMQLIDGRPLDAVIQELRGEDPAGRYSPARVPPGSTADYRAGPTAPVSAPLRTSLRSVRARESYRTAARIGAQVADALEYAHEAGVVHRDIKPANLLLDANGTVWVTDFGLAQVSADASLTRTGDLVGTLRYMSPEQAGGQRVLVDHRTDVYSLGATLYELLTLQPIFPGPDRRSLLRQILEEEPIPPRQVERAIPVELETIVLKAVAKGPEERYATAGEMAADLRRFLDERPILARRPSLIDRTRKWMRRHPSLVGAAVLLLVFTVVGLSATTALTQAAYDRERQRAQEAEERFRLARRAADDLIQVAEEELADKPFLDGVRKRLLEAALSYYQELIEYRREDPKAQAELATTRDRVQKIVADLAALQGAGSFFLLANTAVLDDLHVLAEQRERIAELRKTNEQNRMPVPDFLRLSHEQQRQRFLDEARASTAGIKSILTPEQQTRLGQIALQTRGLSAFQDAEVVAKLRLSVEQRERIRGIEWGLFADRGGFGRSRGPGKGQSTSGGPGKGPPPSHGHGPKSPIDEQTYEAAMNKALAVLTKEQTTRWQEMIGKPFPGAHSLQGRRGPGPGPR
jgi:serine/threonine protein kinase